MLTTTILALLAVSPQDPPPPTSVLMDTPLTVMGQTISDDLMLSEAGEPLAFMSESDPRMALADIVQLPPGFVINSFSRGTGAMFTAMSATGSVYPEVNMGGWSFLMLSVSGSGWSPGSAFRAEADAPGGNVAGDVYAHILDGSDGWFPDGQVDTTHKLRDGDDIGYVPLADIDGFMPGYSATDDYVTEVDAELGDGLKFYFTVKHVGTTGSYSDLTQAWGPAGNKWKRPSTIFVVTHNGVQWDANPSIYHTANPLGIGQWSEICALSVMDPEFTGAEGADGIEVLLSTRDASLDRKLWVRGTWAPGGVTTSYVGPLRTANGNLFAEEKLRITNPTQQYVEAVCGDDPGDDWGSSPHHRYRLERTALVNGDTSGNPNLDFSLHQIKQLGPNSNVTRMRATLQGFVTSNDIYATLSMRSTTSSGVVTYVMRTGNQTPGDKQSRDFEIPRFTSGPELVTFQWRVYGSASQLLGSSQDILMWVR